MKNPLAAIAAALALTAPLAASAQEVPSYASDARYQQDQQIRGRIENFDGGFDLQVRDDQGYIDNVELHDGTIVNPTGLALAPGMVVSIVGFNSGPYFSANELDTPYTYDTGVPYYEGRPWSYYGPSIDLSFFFGNVGWWHGNDFGNAFRYDHGVRIYDDIHIRTADRNGGYGNRGYDDEHRQHAYVPGSAGAYGHPVYENVGHAEADRSNGFGRQPQRTGSTMQPHVGTTTRDNVHGGGRRAPAPVSHDGGGQEHRQ